MIKILKLVTGEEIIGNIYKEETRYVVTRPCAIGIITSQSTLDKHAMGLIPYAGYTLDHAVAVEMDKVVWMADPATELHKQYDMIQNEKLYFANNPPVNIVSNNYEKDKS